MLRVINQWVLSTSGCPLTQLYYRRIRTDSMSRVCCTIPGNTVNVFADIELARLLSRAFSLVWIDAVPETAMALLAARVTAAKLRVKSIAASLKIDRCIGASLVLDRPVDAIGTRFLNLVHHALAPGRAASSAQTGAQLVGKGSRSGER